MSQRRYESAVTHDSVSLDEVDTVDSVSGPWADFFDADRFVTFDAIVARPIKQTYYRDGEEQTYVKPRDALRKAAWSLDNKPWTLDHPVTGRVTKTDQIRGFWSNPKYDEDADGIRTRLFVPANDEEALRHARDNPSLSVGFGHDEADPQEYGGDIGVSDLSDVDGLQTDLYFDHAASVDQGRCPVEAGCGIVNDAAPSPDLYEEDGRTYLVNPTEGYGEARFPVDNCAEIDYAWRAYHHVDSTLSEDMLRSRIRLRASEMECDLSDMVTQDKMHEGTWYAVSPDENADDEWKFPITSCTGEDSVESAWKMRKHGHIDISVETLERRIKERASDLDCDIAPWEEDYVPTTDNFVCGDLTMTDEETETAETDCGCNDNETMGDETPNTDDEQPDEQFSIDVEHLTVDALAERHEGVEELVADKQDLEQKVDSLEEDVSEKEDELEDLREFKSDIEKEEKQELAEDITEVTDKYSEDELVEMSLDDVEEVHELVMDAAATETDINVETDEDDSPTMQREWLASNKE